MEQLAMNLSADYTRLSPACPAFPEKYLIAESGGAL
jgi:hypothetical protein